MNRRKIYDCFCYFNEDMLLKLRLETLWDSVDFFVISEASYTHAGNTRETVFDIANFSKYAEKIRYLRLDQRPDGENDFWKNENFIRNNLVNGLYDAEPDDWIIISDLDEIPNPEVINQYQPSSLRGDFIQRYYSYFLNNYWLGDVDSDDRLKANSNAWYGSKITTYRYFMNFFGGNASNVRSYKSSGPLRALKRTWFKKFNVQTITNGGWHFTWIFTIDDIIKKIESTAHQEFNKAEYKNPAYIQSMIHNGRDFLKPLARYQAQNVDAQFPAFLLNNIDLYKEHLLPVSDYSDPTS